MNPAAYEHCWIGDERVDLPADFGQLYEQLAARFPQNSDYTFWRLLRSRRLTENIFRKPETQ